MGFYSAIKMNDLGIYSTTWVIVPDVMLSKGPKIKKIHLVLFHLESSRTN